MHLVVADRIGARLCPCCPAPTEGLRDMSQKETTGQIGITTRMAQTLGYAILVHSSRNTAPRQYVGIPDLSKKNGKDENQTIYIDLLMACIGHGHGRPTAHPPALPHPISESCRVQSCAPVVWSLCANMPVPR